MRLDQFISQATGLSRNAAQKLARQGRVTIGGELTSTPAAHLVAGQQVQLDGETLHLPGKLYIMLHKPAGVVSATTDPSHRTVLDLVQHPHRHTLHVVGRLDKDTTGVLLLTNDGEWSHRITSPKHHVPKTYLATLAEPLSPAAARQLEAGVWLHGESDPVMATDVRIFPHQQARLTLHEGKYHQVKRMLAAVGNTVTHLHREQVGTWVLDGLPEGAWRELEVSGYSCG